MSGTESITVGEMKAMARKFTAERDWEQFHHPKDLAMAVAMEAGELMEPFLWSDRPVEDIKGDSGTMARVEEELADVVIYAMMMANTLDIDVEAAFRKKMALNELRYPFEKVKGRADKYTAYTHDE